MVDSNSNTQALPTGTRIEEFVIERVLGSGGFGMTYLARDVRLNRQVVIKENLPAQYCFRDPGSLTVSPRHTHQNDVANFHWSLENFSKEASMLASLDHPGIVKVLGSFEAFGTACFVMPYMEGDPLDELARRRAGDPFSEDELTGLLEWLLDALAYLHERGIFHRDIKPSNILVTRKGVPVLIDFGSARQQLGERSMTVVESAGYTPFEQLQSRGNVGPWSDLYALAATVVKLMTGEAPPKANDRTMGDPWQPLAGRAELKGRFTEKYLACLDRALKLPIEERWQNAEEWKAALEGGGAGDCKSSTAQDEDDTSKNSKSPTGYFWSVLIKNRKVSYSLVFTGLVLLGLAGGVIWQAVHESRTSSITSQAAADLPLKGTLLITSEPAGATIVNQTGESCGTTPTGVVGLKAGEKWRGTLKLPGYQPADVEAVVVAGEITEVPVVRLVPQPQKIIVTSDPAGAVVLDEGKELGKTPLEIAEIASGVDVRFSLRLDGYKQADVSGKTAESGSLELHAKLEPISGETKPAIDPKLATFIQEASEARVAGDMGRAIMKLEEALAISPEDPCVHYELGLVHEQMGVNEIAMAHYKKVFQLGSDKAGALYGMAATKLRDGFAQPQAMLAKLALGRVRIFNNPEHEGGQRVVLTIPVQKSPEAEVDASDVKLSVIFFNRTGKGEIVQMEDKSCVVEQWITLPFDWAGGEESLRMTYTIPEQKTPSEDSSCRITYYGQVVSLSYKGEVFDVQAWPRDLAARIPRPPPPASDASSKDEVAAKNSFGWNIVKIGDADYVDLESIKRFYNFTKLLRNNDELILENSRLEAKFQIGSDFCILNECKFHLFEKVASQGDMVLLSRADLAGVLDPVLRPNFVKGAQDFRTVILNPVAGGRDKGGRNELGTEAEYALKVAKRCDSLLQAKGFKVILTRESDQGVSREDRLKKIHAVKDPAIVISIGFASGAKDERGIRTFVCDPTMPRPSAVEADTYAPSLCLAASVHGSALRKLQKHTLDGGVSRIRDSFISQVKHPVIFFQGGFLSHPDEARLIHNDAYQNALATALVDAVIKYRYALARAEGKAPPAAAIADLPLLQRRLEQLRRLRDEEFSKKPLTETEE